MAGVISTPSPPPPPLLNGGNNSRISYINSYNNNSSYNNSSNNSSVTSGGGGGFGMQNLNFNNMSYIHPYVGGANDHHNNQHYHSVPSLRIKTNELFYRWFSEAERNEQIREVINFIKTTNKVPKTNDLQSFRNVSCFLLQKRIQTFFKRLTF